MSNDDSDIDFNHGKNYNEVTQKFLTSTRKSKARNFNPLDNLNENDQPNRLKSPQREE